MSDGRYFSSIALPVDDGAGILTVLSRRFPYYSAAQWRYQLEQGRLMVNGIVAGGDAIVRAGDELSFDAGSYHEPPVAVEYEQLYEDDDLLLIGKPAGTPVMRTGMIVKNTMVNILRRDFANEEISLLHRLDRETSGLLLCAKNIRARRIWQGRLAEIMVRKFYLAVVHGALQVDNIIVDAALGQREGSPIRCRMHVVAGGKAAKTTFTTIATGQGFSLILAELGSGRKHQIRAHLAHLGHPLVGDKIYGHGGRFFLQRLKAELNADDYRELGAENHCLHAWAMLLRPDGVDKLYYADIFFKDFKQYLGMFPGWRRRAMAKIGAA